MNTPTLEGPRPIDQMVLELLRQNGGLTIQELTERLEVTPTAVRQRLERLVQNELVARSKESVGRGRPQFRYSVTPLGIRYTAASYADLARALWLEVMELPNPQQRARVLRRVAKRMGEGLKESVPQTGDVGQRLAATATALSRRKMSTVVNLSGELPVLEVHTCPYPELTEHTQSRHLCELEQEMLSEAIGQSVQLDCCRLDGHSLCQFRPVAGTEH